jgi:hypothetical protein
MLGQIFGKNIALNHRFGTSKNVEYLSKKMWQKSEINSLEK